MQKFPSSDRGASSHFIENAGTEGLKFHRKREFSQPHTSLMFFTNT